MMLKRLKRFKDDSGIAMITALLATMVVATLAGGAFSLAAHTLNSSATDRRRVQAIHAAEAGLDAFLNYLSTVPVGAVSCTPAETQNQTIPTTPSSTFTATAQYEASTSDTTDKGCPAANPGAAIITSVGTSGGVSRKMEAFYGLTATQTNSVLYNGSIFVDGDATFGGQATTLPPSGSPYGADLYSNGSITLQAGGTIYGNVYAQGSLTLKGGADVKQDAVSKLGFTTRGSPIIRGNARSSTAGMSFSNSTIVNGNAFYCTGSAPSGSIGGSKTQQCDPTQPPVQSWTGAQPKQFTYVQADWQNRGYIVQNFSDAGGVTACTQAKTFMATITSGDYVIRINSTCNLAYANFDTLNLKGNMLIVSDGTWSMDGHALVTAGSGNSSTALFVFNYSTPRPCATTGISFNSQAMIDSTVSALIYTPCQVTFGAQSAALSGQIVAGGVSFGAGATITTVPILIPGQSQNGFQQSMRYRREII
jgi:Tfp pilus assembly protein PilX